MRRRGQTAVEYLLLVTGVLIISLIAGMGALNPASREHAIIEKVAGADIAPPPVTLRESEVPSSGGTTTTVTPVSHHPPTVSCDVNNSSPTTGEYIEFSFNANDVNGDLDHADVNVYLNGGPYDSKVYSLSGSSDSGKYVLKLDVNGTYKFRVFVYDSLGDYGICEKSVAVSGATTPPPPAPSVCLEGNVDFYITDLNITPWLPGGVGYALGTEYTVDFNVCRRPAMNDIGGSRTMYVEIYDESEPTAIEGAGNDHSTSFNGCGTSIECNFPSITLLEPARLSVGQCRKYSVKWRPTKGGPHRIVVKLMDVDVIHSYFGACHGFDEAYLVGGILKCADETTESGCTGCSSKAVWWNNSCIGCVRAWDANCLDNMATLDLYAGLVIYFSDCNEITYWLNSDAVKNAVNNGEAVTLVQKNDIVAEPNSDGTPREGCIYATNFDYKDLVTIVGNEGGTMRTIYIGATTGEYNARRAVYLDNVQGLVLKGMHLDCADKWGIVGEREPCVELVSSSASLVDSNVTDFGSVIPGVATAIPLWLKDSSLLLDGTVWLVAVDDSSKNPMWSYFARSMQDTLFVLKGSSQFRFGSSPIVYMKVDSDS